MILEKLRTATSSLHKDLEKDTIMSYLTTGGISKSGYIEILRRFYGFFSPVEEQINHLPIEKHLEDFIERRKASLLKDDLIYLQSESEIELCKNLPIVNNMNHAFGILYVMEGSTLGGVMISKLLKAELQIEETSGGSFFYGYGKLTGKRWKFFLDALNAFSEMNGANQEEIVEGAVSAFRNLKTHLTLH